VKEEATVWDNLHQAGSKFCEVFKWLLVDIMDYKDKENGFEGESVERLKVKKVIPSIFSNDRNNNDTIL